MNENYLKVTVALRLGVTSVGRSAFTSVHERRPVSTELMGAEIFGSPLVIYLFRIIKTQFGLQTHNENWSFFKNLHLQNKSFGGQTNMIR